MLIYTFSVNFEQTFTSFVKWPTWSFSSGNWTRTQSCTWSGEIVPSDTAFFKLFDTLSRNPLGASTSVWKINSILRTLGVVCENLASNWLKHNQIYRAYISTVTRQCYISKSNFLELKEQILRYFSLKLDMSILSFWGWINICPIWPQIYIKSYFLWYQPPILAAILNFRLGQKSLSFIFLDLFSLLSCTESTYANNFCVTAMTVKKKVFVLNFFFCNFFFKIRNGNKWILNKNLDQFFFYWRKPPVAAILNFRSGQKIGMLIFINLYSLLKSIKALMQITFVQIFFYKSEMAEMDFEKQNLLIFFPEKRPRWPSFSLIFTDTTR